MFSMLSMVPALVPLVARDCDERLWEVLSSYCLAALNSGSAADSRTHFSRTG